MTQVECGERGAKGRFPPPLVYLVFILLGVGIQRIVAPLSIGAGSFSIRSEGVAIVLLGL